MNVALWIAGIGLLVFGYFTMIIAYRKDPISRLRWNPSMVGLGAAIVVIGLFFLDKVI